MVFHKGENGETLEPVDEVVVDVDEEFSGTVVEKLGSRRAELVEMIPSQAGGKVRLIFHAPTRGLIGYHSEFLTDTHGTGVMNRSFYDYEPFKGEIEGRRNGVLISSENGTAIAMALRPKRCPISRTATVRIRLFIMAVKDENPYCFSAFSRLCNS